MNITRRILGKMALGLAGATMLMQAPALAQDKPAPFDNPGEVKIALVRYLSTGDFFQAYLSGVEAQA
jgi:simple sugar transport system substrate-binding protein